MSNPKTTSAMKHAPIPRGPRRIARLPEVCLTIGLAPSSVYALMDPASKRHDPTFPRPIKLSVRAVGWELEAVNDWLDARLAAGNRRPADIRKPVSAEV